jgi:hypothetical protein
METIRINIAKDFSAAPGPRYIREGDFSGELFRNTILLPKMKIAIEKGLDIIVDLDGTAGYGTSFLEESFGGLIREEYLDYNQIKKVLKIKSDEELYLIDDIDHYLEEANNEKSK